MTEVNLSLVTEIPPRIESSAILYYRVMELEHDLVEAEAEIARHHRDFESIREVLDEMPPVYEMARRIRGIVG